MHVLHFKTWLFFIHVFSPFVTCGISGNTRMNNTSTGKVYNVLDNKKSVNVIHKNVVDGMKDLQSYQHNNKKGGVVENGGEDLYMVRSVVNGDGRITGSSVSVLSKGSISQNKEQDSGLSIEDKENKPTKFKNQLHFKTYNGKLKESVSVLMDEPDKGTRTIL